MAQQPATVDFYIALKIRAQSIPAYIFAMKPGGQALIQSKAPAIGRKIERTPGA